MMESIIRLACLVFGGAVILVTVGLCLYFMSNESMSDSVPILEILVGGVGLGVGFVVFGIRGENPDS